MSEIAAEYLRYWGLSTSPFSLTPDPEMLFLSTQHKECLLRLKYAVVSNKGGALLVSENAGDGKTTVLARLVHDLRKEYDNKLRAVFIDHPTLTPNQMIVEIARQLGVTGHQEKVTILNELRELLKKLHGDGYKTLVMIDEGQMLSHRPDLLQELRILLNFYISDSFLLTCIFSGQKPLEGALMGMPEFWQRLPVRFFLKNLNYEDTRELIRHRLRKAGLGNRDLFTEASYEGIFRFSQGCPRIICSVADLALVIGHSRMVGKIDLPEIAQATNDMQRAGESYHYFQYLESVRQASTGAADGPAAGPQFPASYCPGCGTPVPPGNRFCGQCGRPVNGERPGSSLVLPSAPEPPSGSRLRAAPAPSLPRVYRLCPECGGEVDQSAAQCPGCGYTFPAPSPGGRPPGRILHGGKRRGPGARAVRTTASPEAPVCPQCGAPGQADASQCAVCNSPLPPQGARPLVVACQHCGKESPRGTGQCLHCGTPLFLLCYRCSTKNPPGSANCTRCGAELISETSVADRDFSDGVKKLRITTRPLSSRWTNRLALLSNGENILFVLPRGNLFSVGANVEMRRESKKESDRHCGLAVTSRSLILLHRNDSTRFPYVDIDDFRLEQRGTRSAKDVKIVLQSAGGILQVSLPFPLWKAKIFAALLRDLMRYRNPNLRVG